MKIHFQFNKSAAILLLSVLIAAIYVFESASVKAQQVQRKTPEMVNAEIHEMNAKIDSYKIELKTVESDVNNLRIDNERLKTEFDNLNRQINALKATKNRIELSDDPKLRQDYNDMMDQFKILGEPLLVKQARLLDRKIEIESNKKSINFSIADATSKIRFLVKTFSHGCNWTGKLEEVVNCWNVYFDGAAIKNPMTVVVPPYSASPNENIKYHYEKDFRPYEKRLNSESIHGVEPPSPLQHVTPPKDSYMEQGEKFMKDFLNELNRKVNQRFQPKTNGPLADAVRG